MIDKFLEGIGSRLADRAVVAIFSPTFVFLAVGVGAWLHAHGGGAGWGELQDRFQQTDGATLVVLVVGILLLVFASGLVVQRFTFPVLRLLEGYWPRQLRGLKAWLVKRQQNRYMRDDQQFQVLAAKRRDSGLSAEENDRYVVLDEKCRDFRATPRRCCPPASATCCAPLRAGRTRSTDWTPLGSGPSSCSFCPRQRERSSSQRAPDLIRAWPR